MSSTQGEKAKRLIQIIENDIEGLKTYYPGPVPSRKLLEYVTKMTDDIGDSVSELSRMTRSVSDDSLVKDLLKNITMFDEVVNEYNKHISDMETIIEPG